MLYARTTQSFGTNTTVVIFSNQKAAGWHLVSAPAYDVLKLLIGRSRRGVDLASLRTRELAALDDIESMGIRLDRKRIPGRVFLHFNASLVDQRTLSTEAA